MSSIFQKNSIRSRMLSGFFFLIVLLMAMAFASLYLLNQSKRIDQINLSINQLQVLTLDMIKVDNDFFDLDLNDETYFATRRSAQLTRRDSLYSKIQTRVSDIIRDSKEIEYNVKDRLSIIDSLEKAYSVKFYELEALTFKRGFKDYGLEGKMRGYAHDLEKSSLDIYHVLTLRRHEKDFLLRHDISYQRKFNVLADQLMADLKHHKKVNTALMLRNYQILFNQLAEVENLIGLNSYKGLRSELNGLTFQISREFYKLANFSAELTSREQRNISYFYSLMLGGALLFSVASAFWISKQLSEPIARLSKLMLDATNDDAVFYKQPTSAASEINTLMDSFKRLMDKTKVQMKEINSKSKLVSYQNKKLKKLNDELDNFLYSTAHDLRSPLASLLGLIRLAQLENQQTGLTEYFDRMKKSVTRQEDFIVQIVSYTKNKKLGLIIEPVDVGTLISEIFESHRFSEEKKITLNVDFESDAIIYTDRTRIQVIFNNLISNAIRYSDPAKECSTINAFIKVTDREVFITFEDNGIGIEQQHQAKIFDMFYRANVSSNGSGLGLFILKKTVDRLGGKVTVESAVHVGTTFNIRMPNYYSLYLKKSAKDTVSAS